MQLHELTALEQGQGIRNGDFSAVDLAEHYLSRIERLNEVMGAYITVTPEIALAQAAAADELIKQDKAPGSPLFGCTAPVKDLDLVAGVRCTFGSQAFQDFVAPVDADFVVRMRSNGLVMTGKTNTPEYGLPCYTENVVAPPARTPWDLARSAGGSSGGAAAAVATGLASVAQGSDGGGSIRIPASVTGLVGIKPTRGRVGPAPLVEQVGELAVIGPIARNVADAAALLDTLAGGSSGDPFALPELPPGSFLEAARRTTKPLRIGRYCEPVLADTEIHPDCLAAYELTTELLVDLGHDVVEVNRPFGPDAVAAFEAVWDGGVAALPLPDEAKAVMRPLTRWLWERGSHRTGADVFRAVQRMREVSRTVIDSVISCDAILTPALAQPPALVGGLRDDEDPASDFEAQKAFTPFTAVYNMTGQPAITLPMMWNSTQLPIAVQLVGRPRDESTIISLAAQLESARTSDPVHDLWH